MSSLNGFGNNRRHRLHSISVLVENRPGVLTRVAGLFARRGYNIDSLAVSTTANKDISRMTIVVDAEDENVLQQICNPRLGADTVANAPGVYGPLETVAIGEAADRKLWGEP